MPRAQPSAEQLHEAFTRVRLDCWPTDYDAAMADPVRSRIVHMHAVRLALGEQLEAPVHHRPAVVRPTPPSPSSWTPRPQMGVDRKRAAAGEHDDD
jgi:hypothetical protein